MLVTSREQKLIAELLKKGSLTIDEMLEISGTSRRTLYRDLEHLKTTLIKKNLELVKNHTEYSIVGDLSNLTFTTLDEWSGQERLFGELAMIIQSQATIKTMTEKFGISQPTVTSDLKIIEANLFHNHLILDRKDGLKIIGNEEDIRSILVGIFNQNISVTDFWLGDYQKNKLFQFFDLTIFEQIKSVFEKLELHRISDKTKSLLCMFMIASVIRIQQNNLINISHNHPSKKALKLIEKLINPITIVHFPLSEIIYLAGIADILYFGVGNQILFMEKFDADFSYKISQLINEVSNVMNIDFSKDDRLHGLLYTHLKNTVILPELFATNNIHLVDRIQADNEKIFKTVGVSLQQIFEHSFSLKEVAYVSLHFMATLERNHLVLPLKAALVTSRGRVSSEFLISNLRKNFPFLAMIDIIQISTKFDESAYDVVFTTEHGTNYLKVDKLLIDTNLDDVRNKLRKIQQNIGSRELWAIPKNKIDFNQLFKMGSQILDQFQIISIANGPTLMDVIQQVVKQLPLQDPQTVATGLKKRFDETPLGIPDTNIALLHGVFSSLTAPYFGIFDLGTAVTLTGMDKSQIEVTRVLVLLSPENVDEGTAYLLGKISSTLIENKFYTTIYSSGNHAVIESLLSQIITESIQKFSE